jgi:hypothetical protein
VPLAPLKSRYELGVACQIGKRAQLSRSVSKECCTKEIEPETFGKGDVS